MNLTTQTKTINTREIAEMMDIRHQKVLEKLEGTKDEKLKGILTILTEHNFVLSDYFTLGTYTDSTGRTNKMYLCTKLGCDFLANKFTGEKGIIFTAKYVKRFNEMEQAIKVPQIDVRSLALLDIINAKSDIETAIAVKNFEQIVSAPLIEKIEYQHPYVELAKKRLDKNGLISITDVTKTFEFKRGQLTRWGKDYGYLHKTLTEVNLKGHPYFRVYDCKGHKCIGVTETGLKFINDNIEVIK